MPEVREINIFQIAKTHTVPEEIDNWLRSIGATKFKLPDDMTEAERVVAVAGRRCYMSFDTDLNKNLTKIREDYGAYFDNLLASGHGSVLEHATYTYAIENVSRVFTAEMNRHRAGWAISEGSLRFIRFDECIPFWMPDSLRDSPFQDPDIRKRKADSRAVFMEAFAHQEQCYKRLLEIWEMDEKNKNFLYKKAVTSCLRRIIGLGVATGGVWTGNVRALRHVITMRCAPVAEEEILHVFSRIAAGIAEEEPRLFGDFRQNDQGYWVPKYVKV